MSLKYFLLCTSITSFLILPVSSWAQVNDELEQTSTEITNELNNETLIENQESKENLKLDDASTDQARKLANEDDEEFGPDRDEIDDDIISTLEDDEIEPEASRPAPQQKRKSRARAKNNIYRGKISPYQKGEKLIEHPNASKGLYKITKDRDYLYRTPKSTQKHSASVRFGMFDPTNLQTEDGQFDFSELYENTEGPMILFDYEWQVKFLGKFSIKIGSGFYFAQGNGRFNSDLAPEGLKPLEDFSLLLLPNSVDAVYRLQFWDEQIIVPYGSIGLDAFSFMEFVDGEGFPKLGGSLGGHFAAGGALNLNFLDRWALLELDRDYGINSVWLTAEFRNYFHITGAFDFSGTIVNGGIAVDF